MKINCSEFISDFVSGQGNAKNLFHFYRLTTKNNYSSNWIPARRKRCNCFLLTKLSIISRLESCFLCSLPLFSRQRMFDWRNSNSNSMLHNAHCITRKYDALASVRSRTDLSVGNLIRNINWHVLVSRITFRTRVTWMLDRCEGENREIQTRLEYVRRSWLTPSDVRTPERDGRILCRKILEFNYARIHIFLLSRAMFN